MSYVDSRHNIELCPNRGLSVLTCGWQQCHGGHLCPRRFYPNHSFTFVLKGKGRYTIEGKTFEIGPGTCFAIFPGLSITYQADEVDPWEYIFAIVSGEDVLPLIKSLGVTPETPTVPYTMTTDMLSNLNRMCKAGASGRKLGYDVIGSFLLCMAEIVEQQNILREQSDLHDLYVEKSIAYMKTNYPYDISVSGVASYVGIEYSYFYRLFKKKLGVSPNKWLINYRLEKAAELMKDHSISITEIAHSVGFYDLPHFTRAFVSRYGITPKASRNKESL